MENSSPSFQFETSPQKDSSKPLDPKKLIQCPVDGCGKVFRFKSEKDRHMISHGNVKGHNCPHPDCSKSFKRLDALKVHMQTHNEKSQYFCPVPGCSAEFKDTPAFKYHLSRHHSPSEVKLAKKNQPLFRAKSHSRQPQSASNLINNTYQARDPFHLEIQYQDDEEILDMTPKTRTHSTEEWSPISLKFMCPEGQKGSQWLRDLETVNNTDSANSNKGVDMIELLHKKLQRENEEMRKKLADQMTSFNLKKIGDYEEISSNFE